MELIAGAGESEDCGRCGGCRDGTGCRYVSSEKNRAKGKTYKKPFKKKKKKGKAKPSKKFFCTLCEKLVIKPREIKTRKNYPHGKKSKATINRTHTHDGGCLVEVRRNDR